MQSAWRIVKEKYGPTAFDGEGAFQYGGRWNSRGRRIVYTSATQSLAALEMLVHLVPPFTFRYLAFRVEIDEKLIERLDPKQLSGDWKAEPAGPASTSIGDEWLRKARTPVLAVPSVIIPSESNYLLNPLHRDYVKLAISAPEPFAFDPRLL